MTNNDLESLAVRGAELADVFHVEQNGLRDSPTDGAWNPERRETTLNPRHEEPFNVERKSAEEAKTRSRRLKK